MVLYIDSDHDRTTGWRGYECSLTATSATKAAITRLSDGSNVGTAVIAYAGSELEASVPRSLIGLACNR